MEYSKKKLWTSPMKIVMNRKQTIMTSHLIMNVPTAMFVTIIATADYLVTGKARRMYLVSREFE